MPGLIGVFLSYHNNLTPSPTPGRPSRWAPIRFAENVGPVSANTYFLVSVAPMPEFLPSPIPLRVGGMCRRANLIKPLWAMSAMEKDRIANPCPSPYGRPPRETSEGSESRQQARRTSLVLRILGFVIRLIRDPRNSAREMSSHPLPPCLPTKPSC